ncbi:MAG TPA: type IV pilus twitching motility protein PilT [Conexibacter sp.]|nr:type IV pilus twitching motility protein PilT [Conexibacter sp.]
MFEIDAALHQLVEAGGSDLHLKAGAPPLVRVNGALGPLPREPELSAPETERVLDGILPTDGHRSEFAADNEVDFAYAIEGLARFRVNAFRQRGTVSLVMRAIPTKIKTADELGLPPVVSELAEESRGIILLTGTTGSGKSTTLAAIIDHINRTRAEHIVTIEDPIEFLHQDKQSILNQREVGADTASFKRALRRVLRQDPDVILIGEMRDEETVHTALSAAETGHLVLSTLHTIDAPETVNRIVDFFPPHQQQQARAMVAGTLKGIISQRLVPTPDRRGRVAVCEILRMTGRAKDMIIDPEQTGRLREVIAEGEFYGMQTFDQALLHHVQAGRVSMEDAMRVATSPHDFKLLVAAEGRVSTSMEDVGGGAETPREPEPREPALAAAEAPRPVSPPAPSAPALPRSPADGAVPSVAPPGFG